ncbi:MAG: right-handed parallel beta-helix repeat-containing protein [Chitinispirillaceae bacterium]
MNIRNGIAAAFSCLAGLFLFTTSDAAVINVPSNEASTISEAMVKVRMGDTVYAAPGVYKERVVMAPGVALISKSLFEAVIDGMGKGTVVEMSKNSTISGFEIRNGTIGIFSSSSGNEISQCRIVRNWQTGIITVRHLPKIQDNIIAFNRASGIQGWDVRSTSASINHNSIVYNGNHGVALGGSSEIIIENNVIAFNERFGLKILKEEEKIQVANNNFYKNLFSPTKPVPSGNFSFDPAFIAPRTNLNFMSDPAKCCKAKGSDDEDLGARLTY